MDAATIAETNRIRVSLGMKPLPVPGEDATNDASSLGSSASEEADTFETREARAYDNYNSHMEAEATKRKREERKAAIRKAQELAQRNLVMEGKGLGEEADGGDIDAKAWLTGQKKRQKKIDKTRKLEEELAAAEAAAAAAVQYTSKDLSGLKVAHDMSTFMDGDGNEQILTLKDTTIDENEEDGDELENVGMREQETLNEKLDLLKKRPAYNPMDDETLGGGILSQYDDEINGKKRKKFTLDAAGMTADLADILAEPTKAEDRKLNTYNLDDIVDGTTVSSDYLDISEIKVKKPKKKKSKGTRQKVIDEDDVFPIGNEDGDANGMDLDIVATKKRKTQSDTFVDDDDLQASLAAQRKAALKKRKKMRPEDIAKELKEQDNQEEQTQPAEEGGIVIGAVSEFVSGLSKPEDEEERKPRKRVVSEQPAEPDEDYNMGDADEAEENASADPPLPNEPEPEPEEEEKTVGGGMGAALALLRERGLVENSRGDEEYEKFRKRQDFLAKKQKLEDELDEETRRQREKDRASGRLDRMSVREREEYGRQQNAWREQQQARRMAELFEANYKPTVNIKYVDETGRQLNTKDAFKQMSHQFHGKGSGKGKTEKQLKKLEDEKRRQEQSMFDASENAGMSRATAQQLKKRKEAGVRLG